MLSFPRIVRASALSMLLASAVAAPLAAQAVGRVTGIVTDEPSGRPLADVRVSIPGTRLGGVTDQAGRYMIGGVPVGTQSVDARRIGYQPQVVRNVVVTDGQAVTVDIKLKPTVLNLEAVVSTGVVDPTSGTRVPFTVGRVEAANLPVPATNALESLQGKMAGVTIVPPGQPGSGTNIQLRTPTSINKSNSPLIVVDGVIQSTAFGAASADLEALDIESIEVVKGAAAASLWGSRAQAGVIQIRTKRGSALVQGVTQFQVRSELGSNSLNGKLNWAKNHFYNVNANGEYTDLAGTTVVPRTARVPKPVLRGSRMRPTATRSTTRSIASSTRDPSPRTHSPSRRTGRRRIGSSRSWTRRKKALSSTAAPTGSAICASTSTTGPTSDSRSR